MLFTASFGLWVSVGVTAVGTGMLSMTFPILVSASTEYSGESKATGVGYMCLGATIASALMMSLFGRQFGESAGQSQG